MRADCCVGVSRCGEGVAGDSELRDVFMLPTYPFYSPGHVVERYGAAIKAFVHAMHGKYSIRRGTPQPHAASSWFSAFILNKPVEDDQLRGRAQVGVLWAKLALRHAIAVT